MGVSTAAYLLISAFSWSFALGVTQILIPLYVDYLGFAGVAMGALLSMPALFDLLRLAGGTFADRWGERRLLFWTFSWMAVAGPLFLLADNYAWLLVAQTAIYISRATYWLGTQTAASRLPGPLNVMLGRLNATYNLGFISGTIAGGFLAAYLGFQPSFLIGGLAAVVALLACLGLPRRGERPVLADAPAPQPRPGAAPGSAWQHLWSFFQRREMYFGILCTFASAMPFSLSQSFMPVLLTQLGYSPGGVGALLAVRAIGAMAMGFFLARFVTPARRVASTMLSLAAMAVAIGLMPYSEVFLLVAVFLGSQGLASALVELNYQLIATRVGGSGGVASALAVGGLGYSLSHFLVPMIIGGLSQAFGLSAAFAIWGGISMLLALWVPIFHRWSFAPGPAAQMARVAPAE